MILKSMLIWLGIIPLAILNGILREAVLVPVLGKSGLPISGILLAAMAFLLTFLLLPRLGAGTQSTYVIMGVIWIVATIIFEFTLGFVTGDSLDKMLAAYNIFTGNLWLLDVIFIGCTPWLTAKIRNII
jgi:hypothetical protein